MGVWTRLVGEVIYIAAAVLGSGPGTPLDSDVITQLSDMQAINARPTMLTQRVALGGSSLPVRAVARTTPKAFRLSVEAAKEFEVRMPPSGPNNTAHWALSPPAPGS